MSSPSDQAIEANKVTLFDRIFQDSKGSIVIAQGSNLPVFVGVTAAFLQYAIPGGQLQVATELIAFGALFTCA